MSALTKERDTLKADNDALKVKMADFDKSVAAELAKRGISPSALNTAPADKTASADADLIAEYQAVQGDPVKRAAFLAKHGEKIRAICK